MASVVTASERRSDAPEWARRYPPLLALAVALGIALVVLPSSLNLPQANPTTTLELAPVPPTEDEPPPQTGNLSSLGLATGESLEGEGALGGDEEGLLPPPPPPPPTTGRDRPRPSGTKNCKGNPPRQTEDPLSPPCVQFFEGDNGGATYQGVTGDEIKIVVYFDPGVYTPTSRGQDTTPSARLLDLWEPLRDDDTRVGQIIAVKNWMTYFEQAFQTYNRKAHFYIYYAPAQYPATPESRSSDAAYVYKEIRPFATITATGLAGASDDYLKFMAQHGVLNFGSVQGRSSRFFTQFPKLVWGYPPTIESIANSYASAVCKTVVNKPTAFGGTGVANGQPRRFGLLYTTDPIYPQLQRQAQLVKEQLQACGANIVEEATYPRNGFTVDTQTNPAYATDNMLKFQQARVTTVLWPGGVEIKQSQSANNLGYFPEWVLAGDGQQDAAAYGQRQDQTVWDQHAWVITPQTRVGTLEEELCFQAYRTVDTIEATNNDVQGFACPLYNDLRQLFTGIQVAGPKLGPASIDKGFHAIPEVASPDPRVPACYYEPGDYTCVKDGTAMWYDRNQVHPVNNNPGCWRMAAGGKRYLNTGWPNQELNTLKNPDIAVDPCNGYDAVENINNAPPNPNE